MSSRAALVRMKCFVILVLLALCTETWAADPMADATAKFLAGLPLGGTALESKGLDPAWTKHAAEFDKAWAELEKDELSKIRDWAPAFLGESYTVSAPMFYMFSGPDFLYANVFFPNAGTYILCGVEPVGTIPDVDKVPGHVLASALANLRKSLESSLSWSFFITKHMKVDLNQTQFSGTLPVLYVFLARAGYTIDSVTPVALDNLGNCLPDTAAKTKGIKIGFTGSSGREQALYYFACDLADSNIKTNPGFLKFCEQQGRGVSLIKAASYLMHRDDFTLVRDFLLNNSNLILQDDSGIPYRFFSNEKWDIRYGGRYTGPIATFKQFPQPDLAKAFVDHARAPIEFAFGYQWHPHRSSLIVATPK
jgi:hypothetical protein